MPLSILFDADECAVDDDTRRHLTGFTVYRSEVAWEVPEVVLHESEDDATGGCLHFQRCGGGVRVIRKIIRG